MNKSPAAILAESIAAGRIKMSRQLLSPIQKSSFITTEDARATNESPNLVKIENDECLKVENNGNEILTLADDPEKFWKCWSLAHASAKNCMSPKECSCFEGIGSVM
jgi:hypothetical protein